MTCEFDLLFKNSQGALKDCLEHRPTVWLNPQLPPYELIKREAYLKEEEISSACRRIQRFAPLFYEIFPNIKIEGGLISSPLIGTNRMYRHLCRAIHPPPNGTMFLKRDDLLPVGGCVKFQGALYHMLCLACEIAHKHYGFDPDRDNPLELTHISYQHLFHSYSVHVASTGNLGISIGSCAVSFGFSTYVHISEDTAQWKRDLLRQRGIHIMEYVGPYEEAEAGCLRSAAGQERSIVVRDDNREFLLGYAAGALSLNAQLRVQGVEINAQHPLFVYLPCGGGGAPTGLSLGLKLLFGDAVHIFYCEPVNAPCMLLGMSSGLYEDISLTDAGIPADTLAEGLSVSRASRYMGRASKQLISGVITVPDHRLRGDLKALYHQENIFIEPAAALSLGAISQLLRSDQWQTYIEKHQLSHAKNDLVHLAWATGGSLFPDKTRKRYLK